MWASSARTAEERAAGACQVNVQTFAELVAPSPDIKARLEQLNPFPVGNAPGEFAIFLQVNMARLAKIAREANVKLD
jgi:tripartite-type tricarboxylate transporter receptor subunit TctC